MAGPYLTVQELLSAPTGIDWSTFPSKGAAEPERLAAVARLIGRAESWIELKCEQSLFATADTDPPLRLGGLRARWLGSGALYLRPRYGPVTRLVTVEVSSDGVLWYRLTGWTPLVADRSPFSNSPTSIEVVPGNGASQPYAGFGLYGDGYARIHYVNGYPNAQLTADAAAGALALAVDDPTGFAAGDRLTIFDAAEAGDETVVLDAGYVTEAAPLVLAAPLRFAHASGTQVSTLPKAVREAAILYATDLVRQRGKDSFAVLPGGRPANVQATSVASKLDLAENNIEPWKRKL